MAAVVSAPGELKRGNGWPMAVVFDVHVSGSPCVSSRLNITSNIINTQNGLPPKDKLCKKNILKSRLFVCLLCESASRLFGDIGHCVIHI